MDNCATRIRDIINKNVSNFVWDESKASGKHSDKSSKNIKSDAMDQFWH